LTRRLAAPAWAGGLLALAWTPLGERIGLLGALRGPLGLALAGLAAALALAAGAGSRGILRSAAARAMLTARARVALLFTLFASVGLYYAARLKVSGDEPHYLLMAQSLWREHDLDLRDNFARGDHREYVPELPAPHYGAARPDGRPFPAHSPGLPLLLAPFYAAGGRAGCVVVLALCAALLCEQTRRLALLATGDERAAGFAWAASAGPPACFYAFHVYTEVPSALAMALALRLLLSGPGLGGSIAAALAAATLPWFHVKMIPAAAALGLIALLWLRGAPRRAFLAVAAAMGAAFLGYYQWVFGSPTPLALYGGVPREVQASVARAAAGQLLDRSFGLLPSAPVWLLALAGLPLLRWRGALAPVIGVGVATLVPVLGWRMWWGGQCPPARFLVPLVPLLGLALAVRLAASGRGLARWRSALLGLTAALALFSVARPESMLLLNRRDRPTRVWDALSPREGVQLGRYLPSLVYPRGEELRVAGVWLATLAVLLMLDAAARRSERADRLFGGLGMPLALLLAASLLTDLWARTGTEHGTPVPALPPEAEVGREDTLGGTLAARASSRAAAASQLVPERRPSPPPG
jgi:hypothetical protein